MEIDLKINNPEYPDIHTMSINMSKEQKEMLPYIIKTIIDMNWINQDKLPDAYRGSDNDVVVYKEKK